MEDALRLRGRRLSTLRREVDLGDGRSFCCFQLERPRSLAGEGRVGLDARRRRLVEGVIGDADRLRLRE